MQVDDETRQHLLVLARRTGARSFDFRHDRPTDWRPQQVRNPDGLLDDYFTDKSAWELIASKIEDGHPLEIVQLEKPPGATGYVMKIDIEPGQPQLYIKLELGSGKIFGRRSFHCSEQKD
ncbi:MAG: hypothetical protein OXU75_05220 [Deltaproteobacteria bacterium]|nr:hypothetical protein [Deltaproteobacteria bacterium]